MVLSMATARELALYAARSEWRASDELCEKSLPDELAEEHPWGWIFEIDSSLNGKSKLQVLHISVDRFCGKTTIFNGATANKDICSSHALVLIDVGKKENDLIDFIQELTGRGESDTLFRLRNLPTVVCVGPMMSIGPINEALLKRGAKTSIEITGTSLSIMDK